GRVSVAAQVAHSEAVAHDLGRLQVPSFKERGWVPAITFLVDAAAIETALLLGYLSRIALSSWWPMSLSPTTFAGLSVGVLVLPMAYFMVGLHPGYGLGAVERLRLRATTTICVFGTLIVWDNIVQSGAWSRGVMLATFIFALLLAPLFEILVRGLLIRGGLWGTPVLMLGAGKTGAMLARILRAEPQLGFVPIAFLDDSLAGNRTDVEGIPILGTTEEASGLKNHVKTVLVTMPKVGSKRLGQLSQNLPFPRIIVVPDLLELPSLWVTSRDLGGVLGLELTRNLHIPRNRIIKRITDYVLSVLFFVMSLPIIAGTALCIKLVSPGPAFYTQERIGTRGRNFRMIKLRTMHPNADARLEDYLHENPAARAEWFRFVKLRNDPRLVPIFGAFFRKISLDELPQLWNVLRGDMSLIGPRPFRDVDLPHYGSDFLALRGSVRPGITGLWQVLARSDGDAKSKETLDSYYIRNWSLWLDLYVLIRTPWAVVCMKGAC
ncbi:MAG: undecaprenyl-phosphate galactose phosphotransferase WbaP, partial [Kiloniellaceae bacterium]